MRQRPAERRQLLLQLRLRRDLPLHRPRQLRTQVLGAVPARSSSPSSRRISPCSRVLSSCSRSASACACSRRRRSRVASSDRPARSRSGSPGPGPRRRRRPGRCRVPGTPPPAAPPPSPPPAGPRPVRRSATAAAASASRAAVCAASTRRAASRCASATTARRRGGLGDQHRGLLLRLPDTAAGPVGGVFGGLPAAVGVAARVVGGGVRGRGLLPGGGRDAPPRRGSRPRRLRGGWACWARRGRRHVRRARSGPRRRPRPSRARSAVRRRRGTAPRAAPRRASPRPARGVRRPRTPWGDLPAQPGGGPVPQPGVAGGPLAFAVVVAAVPERPPGGVARGTGRPQCAHGRSSPSSSPARPRLGERRCWLPASPALRMAAAALASRPAVSRLPGSVPAPFLRSVVHPFPARPPRRSVPSRHSRP